MARQVFDEKDFFQTESAICSTCLSTDRKLFHCKNDNLIYITLNNNMPLHTSTLSICWECNAVIKRFLEFKQNALKAQTILSFGGEAKSLSTLSHHAVYRDTIGENFIVEVKTEVVDPVTSEQVSPEKEPSPPRRSTRRPKKKQLDEPELPADTFLDIEKAEDVSMDEYLPDAYGEEPESGGSDSDVRLDQLQSEKIERAKRKYSRKYTTIRMCEADVEPLRACLRAGEHITRGEHKCSDCLIVFSDARAAEEHRKKMHGKSRRACAKCDVCRAWIKQIRLARHKRSHLLYYGCDLCANKCCGDLANHYKHSALGVFVQKEEVKMHVLSEHRVRKRGIEFKSDPRKNFDKFFSIELSEAEMLKAREREKSRAPFSANVFQCDTCIVSFRTERLLEKHNQHHVERDGSVLCDLCCRYVKTYYFKKHIKEHYMLYVCKICSKDCCSSHCDDDYIGECKASYVNRFWILQHCQTNHPSVEEKCFTCEVCAKQLNTRIAYQTHIQKHNILECTICKKEIKGSYAMQHHMRHCHKEFKSEDTYCAECNKHYKNIYTYRCHLKYSKMHIPAGERRFTCEDCGKKYLNSYGLKDHRNREHLKIPQYSCEQCDQKFLAKKHLERHIKKCHDNYRAPRDKICNVCNKGFTTNQSLKKHMYTHTGERPYKCQLCTATFTQDASLSTHHKLVHLKLKRKIRGNKIHWEPKQTPYDCQNDVLELQ